MAISAGASIVIAKLLRAEEYGVYVMAITILNYGALIARAGTDNASVRFVNEYLVQDKRELVGSFVVWAQRTVVQTSAFMALLGVTIGGGMLALLPTMQSSPVFVAAVGLAPLSLVFLYSSLLRAEKKIVKSQLPLSVLRPTFALLTAALLTVAGVQNGSGVALGEVAGLSLLAVPLYYQVRHLKRPRKQEIVEDVRKKWRSTSRGITLSSVTQQLMGQADIITVGICFGMTSAGIYGLASRVAKLVALGNRAADAIAAPMVAEAYHGNDRESLQTLVGQTCLMVAGATIVMSTGLFVLPEAVFGWLGESFAELRGILLIFVMGHVVNAITGPVGVVLLMTGNEKDQIVINGAFGVALVGAIVVVSVLGGTVETVAVIFAIAIGSSNLVKALAVYYRTGVKCIPAFGIDGFTSNTGPRR